MIQAFFTLIMAGAGCIYLSTVEPMIPFQEALLAAYLILLFEFLFTSNLQASWFALFSVAGGLIFFSLAYFGAGYSESNLRVSLMVACAFLSFKSGYFILRTTLRKFLKRREPSP